LNQPAEFYFFNFALIQTCAYLCSRN